ncbi:MAG: DEAD/DEAH box helicase, partial [Gammaproteobacteria bacterium]
TGTGKTAAFVLPALQRLLSPPAIHGRGPRVLVLTPTRELANQVNEAIRQLGRYTSLKTGTIVGGLAYPPQERMLSKPLDLLVATPGRLMDHMERRRVDFSRLELLVLDEADRMLDMGFINDVERIAAAIPTDPQTLLFGATLEGGILKVAAKLLKEPARLQMGGVRHRHELIAQRIHQCDDLSHKHALLNHLLKDTAVYQAIVFTATKRSADKLVCADHGLQAAALHSDLRQGARNRIVERLRRGKLRVLVATDVAGRGLDVKDITHVINFDLPIVPEDYVHRIGRTGRAGSAGTAISLIGPNESAKMARIERLLGYRLDREIIPGLEPRRSEPLAGRHPQEPRPRTPHRGHASRKFTCVGTSGPVAPSIATTVRRVPLRKPRSV